VITNQNFILIQLYLDSYQILIFFATFFFVLFHITKPSVKMMSFFKYYNVISLSDLSKIDGLIKKYFDSFDKRNTDKFVRKRISEVIRSKDDKPQSFLMRKPNSLIEYLETNNIYTFPFLNITSRTHNIMNMYADIKNNIKVSEDFVVKGDYARIGSTNKKHIDIDLFEYGVKELIDNHDLNKIPLSEFYDQFYIDFDSFFDTNTNGTNPNTGKKEKNTKIMTEIFIEYFDKTGNNSVDALSFTEWCIQESSLLGQNRNRTPFSLVSIKPQKDASDREIYIQCTFSKTNHFPSQVIGRVISNHVPEELVTKSTAHKIQMMVKMKFTLFTFYVNADMQKWSGQDVRNKFKITFIFLRKHEVIDDYLFNLAMNGLSNTDDLNILFDQDIDDYSVKFFEFSDFIENNFNPLYGMFKQPNLNKRNRGFKFTSIKLTKGWPQGLLHFMSTLVHGVCAEVEKMAYRAILPGSENLILYHSDDKNESITHSSLTSLNQVKKLSWVFEVIPLSFSLASSSTKTSVTYKGSNTARFFNDGQKLSVSELVGIYNVESNIVDSYMRQSANITNSLINFDAVNDHLSLITRCCNTFRLSNQLILSEMLYVEGIRFLKRKYPDCFDNSEDLIAFGGCKSVSIFEIAKYTTYSDNIHKMYKNWKKIVAQGNVILTSSNLVIDAKSAKKFQNKMLEKSVNLILKNNSKGYEYTKLRCEKLIKAQRGVFLNERSINYFNLYFRKGTNMYKAYRGGVNFNELDLNWDEKENLEYFKAKVKEEIEDYTSFSGSKFNEFLVGSQSIMLSYVKFIEARFTIEYKEKIDYKGDIFINKIKEPVLIKTEFSECCSLLSNPNLYRSNCQDPRVYNSMIDDIIKFKYFFNILTVDQFESENNRWDLLKKFNINYNPIFYRYTSDLDFKDVLLTPDLIYKSDFKQKISMSYNSVYEKLRFSSNNPSHLISRIKNCLNKDFYYVSSGENSSLMMLLSSIKRTVNSDLISSSIELSSDYSVTNCLVYMSGEHTTFSTKGFILLHHDIEEDVLIYNYKDYSNDVIYIIEGESILLPKTCSKFVKNKIEFRHKDKKISLKQCDEKLRFRYPDIHPLSGIVTRVRHERDSETSRVNFIAQFLDSGNFQFRKTVAKLYTDMGSIPMREKFDYKEFTPTISVSKNYITIESFLSNELKDLLENRRLTKLLNWFENIQKFEVLIIEDERKIGLLTKFLNDEFPSLSCSNKSNFIDSLSKKLLKFKLKPDDDLIVPFSNIDEESKKN